MSHCLYGTNYGIVAISLFLNGDNSSPLTHTHTDGTVLGVVLDSASQEELTQFDALLTELAALRVQEEGSSEREGEKQEVGVAEGVESQWGNTVAGVSQYV